MKLGTVAHSCDPSIWETETEVLEVQAVQSETQRPFQNQTDAKGGRKEKGRNHNHLKSLIGSLATLQSSTLHFIKQRLGL